MTVDAMCALKVILLTCRATRTLQLWREAAGVVPATDDVVREVCQSPGRLPPGV